MLPTINFDNPVSSTSGEQKPSVTHDPKVTSGVGHEQVKQAEKDAVQLSDFHPARARKLLNDKIIASLNSVLEADGIKPLDSSRAEDFTPEKVANRILDFIDSAMGLAKLNGADDAELEHMLEEAKRGVDMGFEQAKDILDGYGVLEGKIAEDIDSTYNLIQEGFKERDFGNVERIIEVERGAAAAREDSFEMEIRTNDGDIVKLMINNSNSISTSQQFSSSDDEHILTINTEKYSSSELSFSVQGELDEDELAAINDLVGQIGDVAEDFYSGDMQQALQHAVELGYDTDEIAGFEAHMKYSTAVSAYQKVDSYVEQPEAQQQLPAHEAEAIGTVNDKIKTALSATEMMFPEPNEIVKQLFEGIVKMSERFKSYAEANQPKAAKIPDFSDLVDSAAKLKETVETQTAE
ncbi:MAG: hypothetical protein D6B28_04765 [Gammaproteobacteria bacterium]|nr:MAG: hypothetical protein D6B28_04765 [Gammaproteobacteria bacterium]